MAAKAKAPQVKPPRTIAQLEAELVKRTVERDDALARVAKVAAERDEALEQQTATAEVLQVINSSPGDLKPVFDAMLQKALSLCEASFGVLVTFDGVVFRNAAWLGYEPRPSSTVTPTSGMALYQLVHGEQIVHIHDITADDVYRSGNAVRRRLADGFGGRTAIWVALRKDAALFGAFVIYRTEARPFSVKQIALLQNFAAQAVIAIENARLLGELRQRTDEVAELNRGLEARVAEQVEELGRVERLKRFLAPQLAELIVSHGDEKILESHRRGIVVVFCDLRGYTAFTETAEPEEVLDFLREYMEHWGRSSASSRAHSTSSRGTGSWCFSMTRCRSRTRPRARSTWRWRCARRPAR
jgi:GAF domain-containing protein